MKTTFVISLICSVLIALIACRELTTGKVVDKHYRPGFATFGVQRIGKATYTTTNYHPPTYMLRVDGYNKKGEHLTEWWYVTSGTYEHYPIGTIIKDTTSSY